MSFTLCTLTYTNSKQLFFIYFFPFFAEGVDVKINYNFETVRRKDKIYGQPRDFKLYFDIQDMTIHLDNLFNGDKFLGKWLTLLLT